MKKRSSILILAMLLLVGVTTTVKAATSFSALKVTKLVDGESRSYKSGGYSHADVTIGFMTNTGKYYEVWVESDATGYNISETKSFSYPCSLELYYKTGDIVNSAAWTRMNISTSVNNLESCYFTGTWTPNGE